MQKCPVYLYTNSIEVILDLDQNTRIHNVMYQHDLKIQKGLKNKVQLQFKNSDQKRINVSTGTFVFSMFDAVNNRQLIKKDITVIDDGATTSTRGLGLLELSESDTLDLDVGKYQFTVASQGADGSYEPTYANTYYGVSGSIELRQDSFPVLQSSQEALGDGAIINQFQIQSNLQTGLYEYYSGNLYANPSFNGNTALHTMAFYLTGYKGRVLIEGTQENSPGFFANYAVLSDVTYNEFTGVDYKNFYGVWSYVRVRYIPEADPLSDNRNISYRGTFDKVLYRS